MKTRTIKNLLPYLALAALLAASCRNDDPVPPAPAPGDEISFNIGFMAASRVSTNIAFKSNWENGDEIGIFAVRRVEGDPGLAISGNFIHNVRLTYNGTWKPDEDKIFYWPTNGDKLDFYAYYPYNAGYDNPMAMEFTVLPDQNATTGEEPKSNYGLSDLMAAKNDNGGNGFGKGDNVQLAFSHMLALVQLEITDTDDPIDDRPVEVTLLGFKPAAVLDLGGDPGPAAVSSDENNVAKDIVMHRVGTTGHTYRAIVPVQSVTSEAGNINLFSVNIGEAEPVIYRISSNTLDVVAGQTARFTLTLPAP